MSYMDINLTGETFTDYQLSDVGASAFELEHDWFTKQDLVIRTAAGGGGTLLVEGTDYTLSVESEDLSDRVTAAVGSGRNVYHNIAIINATYQSGSLYFSGKYIADSNSAEDMNWLRRRFESVEVSADDYTIDDEDPDTILVTAGAAARTITLPTAADNAGRTITVQKVDSGAGAVVVDGEGAEVIFNQSTSFAAISLWNQGDFLILYCDGTQWWKRNPATWHRIPNPTTDYFGTKTSGWTADSFSGGWNVDFSSLVPAGALAIEVLVVQGTGLTQVFYRPGSDANIANTPVASKEYSHKLMGSDITQVQCHLRLSSSYTVDFAVNDTACDMSVSYPAAYLQ